MATDYPEFYEGKVLEDKAQNIILNGSRSYSNTFKFQNREFRIIKYSYIHPYIHWEIFNHNDKYYICRLKWFYETDWNKFRNPSERLKYPKLLEPSITYKCQLLKENLFEEFREELLSSNHLTNDTNENNIGCDDFKYELFMGEESNYKASFISLNDKSKSELNFIKSFLHKVEDFTETWE